MAAGQPRRGGSRTAVLIVMCVGYFLVLLDVTIVNVGLPRIGSALHAGVSDLQWVVDGYALALASLMLAGGTAGDSRGHKAIVLGGLVVFGVGSLACGLAPSVGVLIGARVAQGVGAALLLPGTLAIISHAFPEGREQARAIGVWAGIGSLALPAGPLLGGILISGFGWRAIFLLNVPIVVLALAASLALVHDGAEESRQAIDAGGVLLGMLTLLAITFAFIQAGRAGVGAPEVVAATGAAIVLIALFLAIERRRGSAAMLPLELFRRPAFTVANATAGAMNLGTLGTLFVLTLFLQSVRHASPLLAGLQVIPLFAPLVVVAPLAGRLASRIGPRLPIAAGLTVAAAGLGLLAAAGPGSSYLLLLLAFGAWGTGLGILTPSVVAAAIDAVPRDRAGLGSAINNTARQAGGAIGIALAGAIAGTPGSGGFLAGFHGVALGAGALYVIAAVLGLSSMPGRVPSRLRSSLPSIR